MTAAELQIAAQLGPHVGGGAAAADRPSVTFDGLSGSELVRAVEQWVLFGPQYGGGYIRDRLREVCFRRLDVP